jgi:hypothetical protein
MNSEKYIGLDVHQATIVVAVTDSIGTAEMEQHRPKPRGTTSD